MRRRRGLWLVLAGVLFALASGLMLSGQGEQEAPARARIEFPRGYRPAEFERAERRRTYVTPVAQGLDAGTAPVPSRPRDPLMAALPRGPGKSVMVIEANALRHSPIGEMLLECLMREGREELEDFRQRTGVDPLEDLDRLVLTDEGIILSGNFKDPRLRAALRIQGSADYDYGQQGRLFERPTSKVTGPSSIGLWNDQMLVFGRTPQGVKEVMDRVEGHGAEGPSLLDENQTYGEMYGVLSVEQLRQLLPPEQQELAGKLAEVAGQVELHVDATSDFAMTAQVRGADAQKVEDLGKALGGALALARLQAQAENDPRLAQLLELARVRPDGKTFNLELAVPLDTLRQNLSFCRERRQPTPDAPPHQAPR